MSVWGPSTDEGPEDEINIGILPFRLGNYGPNREKDPNYAAWLRISMCSVEESRVEFSSRQPRRTSFCCQVCPPMDQERPAGSLQKNHFFKMRDRPMKAFASLLSAELRAILGGSWEVVSKYLQVGSLSYSTCVCLASKI